MPPRTVLQLSRTSLPPSFLLPGLERLTIRAPSKIYTQSRSIRSITKNKKLTRFDHDPEKEPFTSSQAAALLRKLPSTPRRPGLLGYKRAMSAVYDSETGIRTPVTIIQLDRNQVVAHKVRAKHGYIAACIGCGSKAEGNVTRPMLGHYASQGVDPKRHLREFRVAYEEGLPAVGTFIDADWFTEGQYVDARAKSRGMGFAGGMKRHGFGGQDRSHGVSLAHRSMGSAGQGQGGGSRVYPGKRMPGRMGGEHVTVQTLRIVRVDKENGLIAVAGAVPGPKRALVQLSDAKRKPWPEMPAAYTHLFADAKPTSPSKAAAES